MPKLNPLLESDSIECAHKGKILLQSSTKDIMCVQDSSNNDAGMISLGDLANATIIGCTNNIAGVPSPCTKLVNIPNSICSTMLEINNQKIVLAQAISQVITDKGSPLILQDEPKAKDIFELDEDIADFDNTQNHNGNAESTSKSNAESNSQSNTDSSNSQSTQDSQKEILEMYFSYGEEMIKLEDEDSRHSNDMNLHIVTSGYEDNEQIEIEVKTQSEIFIINAAIH
ncbi:T6SS effector amidase Tae4 family protein, partial [Helicobacter sp. T3_23-1059]